MEDKDTLVDSYGASGVDVRGWLCWGRGCCAKLESTRWQRLAMVVRRRNRDDETMMEWAVDRARRVK